jgi:SAM-dependent methyltransferase
MHGYFDVAVSFHVLEHVGDPKAFLQTLSGFVKPNGIIGISVPNQAGPIRFIEPCAMNMPPHHATRWRLRTFEVLAEILGWKIERVAYEPLLLENHSYYSIYWLQHIMPGSSGLIYIVRNILSLSLRAAFSLLYRVGLKYFRPLRGQSIYVLMSTGSR